MQEAQLYHLWQTLALSGQTIRCGQHVLQVVHAGQLNLQRGPDFLAARFRLNGILMQGDVEMHAHSKDWYRHQHHLDPAFRNVCLHVVLQNTTGSTSTVHSQVTKRSIPTIELKPEVLPVNSASGRVHCHPPARLQLNALASLALKRLHTKVRYFQHVLETFSFEQAFYEHLLRTLGYPNNSWPFQLLARRLPWRWLERLSVLLRQDFDLLYALYAGTAGFLPKQPDHPYVQKLVFLYQESQHLLPLAPLAGHLWQSGGQRPRNHPHFRLAGWVALFQQFQQLPLQRLHTLFANRQPVEQLWAHLLAYFDLQPQNYWKEHVALGGQPVHGVNRNFWGPARVAELTINVLIPLFAAQAAAQHSLGFFEYLQDVYLTLPLQTTYGRFQRFFPWLKQYTQRFPRQALLQGLWQLHQHFCQWQRCPQCPLAHIIDKDNDFH